MLKWFSAKLNHFTNTINKHAMYSIMIVMIILITFILVIGWFTFKGKNANSKSNRNTSTV